MSNVSGSFDPDHSSTMKAAAVALLVVRITIEKVAYALESQSTIWPLAKQLK